MTTKPFWQSRMFWVNFVSTVLALAGLIVEYQDLLPMLGLSSQAVATLLIVVNAIINVLRKFMGPQSVITLTAKH